MGNGNTGEVFLLRESSSQSGDASSSHPEIRRRNRGRSSARSMSPTLPFQEQPVLAVGASGWTHIERASTLGANSEECAPESRTLSQLFLRAVAQREGIDGTRDEPPRGISPRRWITREAWWLWAGAVFLVTEPVGYPAFSHYHVCPECRSGYGCIDPCPDRHKAWDRQASCGECQTAAHNRRMEKLCRY